ncbi:hypothetical protein NM688_g3608 [Phlebia brevispora]|uniref:Uncharacterized protein n=1 Tax=Phlebia brevispora TaxID=194682 RepID=A0ACC1T5H7_9APHY|nr:hypothetical protein NM688_g3608 [Phlebia brevispora]
MSATTSDSVIVAEYDSDLVFNYVVFSALTMISYEYAVTFRYEVEFIWRRRWSTSTWLFLANRYLLVANVIIQAAPFSAQMLQFHSAQFYGFPTRASGGGCGGFLRSTSFCIARSCLYPCRIHIFARSISACTESVSSKQKYSLLRRRPGIGELPLILSRELSLMRFCSTSLASILCTIAVDVIAIVTTWIKTHHHVREASAIGMNVGVSSTLLRYGTLYFLVLLVSNIAQGICSLPLYQNSDAQQATVFLLLLPNIVLSRFMINLRLVESAEPGDATHFSASSQPNFRIPTLHNIVGNLGEMLADEEEALYNDDEVTNSETSQSSGNEVSSFEMDEGTPAIFSIEACERRELLPGVDPLRADRSPPIKITHTRRRYNCIYNISCVCTALASGGSFLSIHVLPSNIFRFVLDGAATHTAISGSELPQGAVYRTTTNRLTPASTSPRDVVRYVISWLIVRKLHVALNSPMREPPDPLGGESQDCGPLLSGELFTDPGLIPAATLGHGCKNDEKNGISRLNLGAGRAIGLF